MATNISRGAAAAAGGGDPPRKPPYKKNVPKSRVVGPSKTRAKCHWCGEKATKAWLAGSNPKKHLCSRCGKNREAPRLQKERGKIDIKMRMGKEEEEEEDEASAQLLNETAERVEKEKKKEEKKE